MSLKERVDATERVLFEALPGVPFHDQDHLNRFRVVFSWDGIRVILARTTQLPSPTAGEIATSFAAFLVAAKEVLKTAGRDPRVIDGI